MLSHSICLFDADDQPKVFAGVGGSDNINKKSHVQVKHTHFGYTYMCVFLCDMAASCTRHTLLTRAVTSHVSLGAETMVMLG